MLVLVFIPNDAEKPVPAFMKHSFNSTHGRDFDADPTREGHFRNGWPIGEFFARGYGFVAVETGTVDSAITWWFRRVPRQAQSPGAPVNCRGDVIRSLRLGPRRCEFLAGILRLRRRFQRFPLIASGVRLGPQPDPREPGGLLMERRFSGVVALVATSLRDDDAWGRSTGRAEALSTLRNRGALNSCEAAAATSRGRA